MTDIAKLVVALEAQSAQFTKEIEKVNSRLGRFEKQVNSTVSKIKNSFNRGLKNVIGVAAVGLAVRAVIGHLDKLVDGADRLQEFSQKVGISVESLSTLEAAAAQFGLEAGQFESSIVKLNKKIGEAAGGNKEAVKSFQKLGLSVREADGTIKSSEQVLGELADRFKSLPDGPLKTAAALDIFGKAGADLIPFLNEGSAGIEKLKEAMESIGGQVSTEFAKASDEFKDKAASLGTALAGVGREILERTLPPLSSLITKLKNATVAFREFLDVTPAERLKELPGEIARLEKIVDNSFLAPPKAVLDKLAAYRKELALLKSDGGLLKSPLSNLNKEIDAITNASAAAASEAIEKQKELQKAAENAAKEALRAQQATADALFATAKDSAERQLQDLENLREQDLISIEDYYNQRAAIQTAAIDAEIKQQQRLLELAPEQAERIGILNEIEILQKKRTDIAKQAAIDAAAAREEVDKALKDLELRLREAQGDSIGANVERLRIELNASLERLGPDAVERGREIINALIPIEEARLRLQELEDEFSRSTQRIAANTELLEAQKDSGLINQSEFRKQTSSLQKEHRALIESQIADLERLASTTTDPVQLEQIRTKIIELEADFVRLGATANETLSAIKAGFEDSLSQLFTDLADGSKSAADAFRDFGNSVIRTINRIAAEAAAKQIADLLFKGFGAFGGAFGGGGGGDTPFGFSLPVPGLATGGPVYPGNAYVVGEEGSELFVPKTSGHIIPHGEMGGVTVVINQNIAAPNGYVSRQSANQAATEVGMSVRQAMARFS